MLLFGVLLAVSLLTLVGVFVSCEAQERAVRTTGSVRTLAGPDRSLSPHEAGEFDRIVAPLAADPDFGRIDWYLR